MYTRMETKWLVGSVGYWGVSRSLAVFGIFAAFCFGVMATGVGKGLFHCLAIVFTKST